MQNIYVTLFYSNIPERGMSGQFRINGGKEAKGNEDEELEVDDDEDDVLRSPR